MNGVSAVVGSEAVRAELRRAMLLDATDEYLEELIDEVGEPSPSQKARAEAIARQLMQRHSSEHAGRAG